MVSVQGEVEAVSGGSEQQWDWKGFALRRAESQLEQGWGPARRSLRPHKPPPKESRDKHLGWGLDSERPYGQCAHRFRINHCLQ